MLALPVLSIRRRGVTARKRLEREVRKTRTRFERELRQRRRALSKGVSTLEQRRDTLTKNDAYLYAAASMSASMLVFTTR